MTYFVSLFFLFFGRILSNIDTGFIFVMWVFLEPLIFFFFFFAECLTRR